MKEKMNGDCKTETIPSIRVDLTSGAFNGTQTEAQEKFQNLSRKGKELGMTVGVQLHNSANSQQIENVLTFNCPISFHAPVGNPWNVNLAAADDTLAWSLIEDNARRMRLYGADMAVFHSFIMTDLPVQAFGHGKSYTECMKQIFRKELSPDGVDCHCSDFFQLPEYRERLERQNVRLEEVRKRYPDLTFCIETDFPAYGSGNIFAAEMTAMKHPICLDTSHLWCSCNILGHDYHTEIADFLRTGLVKMVHLHASVYTAETPHNVFWDGHLALSTPNTMDLPRVVSACRRAGVRYFVLEINQVTEDDLILLNRWWNRETGCE